MRVESEAAGASEVAAACASGAEDDDESVRAGGGRVAVAEVCGLADIVVPLWWLWW